VDIKVRSVCQTMHNGIHPEIAIEIIKITLAITIFIHWMCATIPSTIILKTSINNSMMILSEKL
jgi:hypothetical protein